MPNFNRSLYESCVRWDTSSIKDLLHQAISTATRSAGALCSPSVLPIVAGTIAEWPEEDKAHSAASAFGYSCFVISLSGSTRLWNFASSYNLSRPFKVIEGIDALSRDFDYKAHKELNSFKPVPSKEGFAGCSLSHIKAWRKAVQSDSPYYLFFEDDAVFSPYSEASLANTLRSLPDDADIVHLNGRSAEKLYMSKRWVSGVHGDLHFQNLYSRSEVTAKILDSFDALSSPHELHLLGRYGGDGYLLTRQGIHKLLRLVDQCGLGRQPCGPSHCTDLLLSALTTCFKDHSSLPMACNLNHYIRDGFVGETPFLNGFVLAYPLVDVSERVGRHSFSEIHGATLSRLEDDDIFALRDAALLLENQDLRLAAMVMTIAKRLRPRAPFISKKVREYSRKLEKLKEDIV